MNRIRVGLGLCLLTMVCVGHAGVAGPPIDLDKLKIPHDKFVLDNGLTLIVHSDHSVPLVAVNLWYHVGSRDEQPGRTGFAHLFEHFFFNGSENYPHGFREAMDDLGANNRNGTTSNDRTNFFEDVPVSALERTLYLEADRMGFLAGNLSEAMLERERGVVKNEKRQGENQPYGGVFNRITEKIYPAAHPYSWPVIGSMADLDAARMSDVQDWYRQFYGPNNAVLVLAGDITADAARDLVEKYFGDIPPGPPLAKTERWVPVLAESIRDRLQDRVPQTRVIRAWHLPPLGDRELFAIELFAEVLAGSDSGPLRRGLVFDQQLATSANAIVWGKELTSTLIVQLSIKPGASVAAAEQAMDTEIDRLLSDGLKPDELQRARTRLLAAAARGLERLGGFGGRSDVLAESMTYHGDPEAYLTRLRALQTIDAAELRRAAKRWLTRPHYTLTVDPFPALKPAANAVDRAQLPALADPPAVPFPALARATLDNGLKIVLLERHTAPLVNVSLAIDAGSAADSRAEAGTAQFVLDLLLKGSKLRDAFAIADARDALGAQLFVQNSKDLSLIHLKALTGQLQPSLDLLAEVVRQPSFPPDMIALQRKQQLAAIEQQKANPAGAVERVIPALMYGEEHPYARTELGDGEVVERIQRAQLQAWHERWFTPANATLFVAGDISMPELLKATQASFGDWRGGKSGSKSLAAAANAASGKVFLIDKSGAPQTVIVATHLAPDVDTAAGLAEEALMRNFGGMATSRLNRNLRLDKHWSYGSWGGLSNVRGPRLFQVIAPVQTDKTREAIVELIAEIRGLAGERPVRGEEFESIKRSQIARLPGRFETLDSLITAAMDVQERGRDDDYYQHYARRLRALSESDLASADKVVQPETLTWIVIGDLKLIEAGVRSLELGEIARIQVN